MEWRSRAKWTRVSLDVNDQPSWPGAQRKLARVRVSVDEARALGFWRHDGPKGRNRPRRQQWRCGSAMR
jgi:hypothetical protein